MFKFELRGWYEGGTVVEVLTTQCPTMRGSHSCYDNTSVVGTTQDPFQGIVEGNNNHPVDDERGAVATMATTEEEDNDKDDDDEDYLFD